MLWAVVLVAFLVVLYIVALIGGCVGKCLPGPDDTPVSTLTAMLLWAYTRIVHRLRIEGEMPRLDMTRGLLVVCNHTAGIDPMLVQQAVPRFVRWMMAEDMIDERLRPIYEWLRIIEVDRDGGDKTAVRAAIRVLRGGECVGIFPEGRIHRDHETLAPFHAGVGLIASMSGCDVLPVVVTGTPRGVTAFGSLLRTSRSVVRVLALVRAEDLPRGSEAVTRHLERVVSSGREASLSVAAGERPRP